MTAAAPARERLSFGPFTLIPGERALTRNGTPVELGDRGLDILIALRPWRSPSHTLSRNPSMARSRSSDGAVAFVDLGAISDPGLIATTLALMLGLSVQREDAESIVVAHLRNRRVLILLDTCEHLIEAVAPLTTRLFEAGAEVHILATSREALRVDGEHVFVLSPLPCPPDDPTLTAGVVETFPAAQLFLERARASGARVDFDDAEATLIALLLSSQHPDAEAASSCLNRSLEWSRRQSAKGWEMRALTQRTSHAVTGPDA